MSVSSHRCGICHKKVRVTSVSGLGVHWWQVVNKLEDGVLTTCQAAHPCDFSPFIPSKEILSIPHLVMLTGSHGSLWSLLLGSIQCYFLKFWSPQPQFKCMVIVSFYLFKHLCWWSNPTNLQCGLPLFPPEFTHVLTIHASGDGWVEVLDSLQSVHG